MLTALRVLEEVAARQPVGVSDLSRALGMPKTTVQRAVLTLAEAGWLRAAESEITRWQISHRALTVGLAGVNSSGLDEISHEEMRRLRDLTSETVHLAIPDGNELVIISRLEGTLPVRTYLQLGTRAPLHASATGRAVLATMSDEEIDRILAHGPHRWTDRTLVDRDDILAEIGRTRERGYALNPGEWRQGIGGIAVAVLNRQRRASAGLSISMPLNRYEQADLPHFAGLLSEAAVRIGQLSGM